MIEFLNRFLGERIDNKEKEGVLLSGLPEDGREDILGKIQTAAREQYEKMIKMGVTTFDGYAQLKKEEWGDGTRNILELSTLEERFYQMELVKLCSKLKLDSKKIDELAGEADKIFEGTLHLLFDDEAGSETSLGRKIDKAVDEFHEDTDTVPGLK
ncbi:MAG: hypothetical protein KBD73_02935 [Candidatus Magasanikbacteria bacterium]|nr:hypothetical protein [Candidatus Magasanikbacteria bacterium]